MLLRVSTKLDWLGCFASSTMLVILGVCFGRAYIPASPDHVHVLGRTQNESFIESFANWDGAWYRKLANEGYSEHAGEYSGIHFFPLYPMLGKCFAKVTGLPIEYSLVFLSNLCFLAALYVYSQYVDLRTKPAGPPIRTLALMSLAFLPSGVFFHFAYTESLFLLLCIVTLLLIERRSNPFAVAGVVALATATRAVGVALLLPLVAYVHSRAKNWQSSLVVLCFCCPLALAGLFSFMLYCLHSRGDAFAFFYRAWDAEPPLPFLDKLFLLETLQPVWSVYLPSSPSFWGRNMDARLAFFTLYAVSPLYFVSALGLVIAGWKYRWMNRYELLLALGLLCIPYWFTAYESRMMGMPRYVSVIFPLYFAVAHLLAKSPLVVNAALLAICGLMQTIYAALFARSYAVF